MTFAPDSATLSDSRASIPGRSGTSSFKHYVTSLSDENLFQNSASTNSDQYFRRTKRCKPCRSHPTLFFRPAPPPVPPRPHLRQRGDYFGRRIKSRGRFLLPSLRRFRQHILSIIGSVILPGRLTAMPSAIVSIALSSTSSSIAFKVSLRIEQFAA